MTSEQRKAAAQKGAATRRQRHEAEMARFRAELNDKAAALEICREIRDNPETSDGDRLEAIRMIEKMKSY